MQVQAAPLEAPTASAQAQYSEASLGKRVGNSNSGGKFRSVTVMRL